MVVCGKTAEPTEMPLALWVRMAPKNHKLDGSPSPMRRGKFLGENGRPIVKYRDTLWSSVNCAKTAEPIGMPFGLWTRMGRRNHVLDGGP